MIIFFFFITVWYASLFSQTFFQHRYAAHGAFTMSKGWERFFFIVAYVTQGSSYMSPKTYAIMHRLHHAYTDTEKDPHSPSFSSNIFSMMWRTRRFYQDIYHERIDIENKFTKNVPEWRSFDRFANSKTSRRLWILLYTVFFLCFATNLWMYVLLPVVFAMGAFHGAVINWFAHRYGYINFKLKNTSMNLFSVDILMLGESYHNNHHKHPSSVNFGHKWFEIDPIYPIIRFLGYLKIIKISKSATTGMTSSNDIIPQK